MPSKKALRKQRRREVDGALKKSTEAESDSEPEVVVEAVNTENLPEALKELGERTTQQLTEVLERHKDGAKAAAAAGGGDGATREKGAVDGGETTANQHGAEGAPQDRNKKRGRMSLAELKQLVARPDLVEMHDVASRCPLTVLHLKAMRNLVPVPAHWAQKRKYLSARAGAIRQPFQMPDYIAATGVARVREESLNRKKSGGVFAVGGLMQGDTFQAMSDAFFKYQQPPLMTGFGEVYFEGRELQAKCRHSKPGRISERLRKALGMDDNAPPPWLFNMQNYGQLPPSYQTMKIPGLNAPIPLGAQWGWGKGCWGQPIRDAQNNLKYPEVLGVHDTSSGNTEDASGAAYWGAFATGETAPTMPEYSLAAMPPPQAPPSVPQPDGNNAPPPPAPAPPLVGTNPTVASNRPWYEELRQRQVGLTSGLAPTSFVYETGNSSVGSAVPSHKPPALGTGRKLPSLPSLPKMHNSHGVKF